MTGGGRRDLDRPLLRLAVAPSWVVTAALIVPFALGLGDGLPAWLVLGALLVGAVVVGLPHGAVDHLALPRVRGRRPTPRHLAAVGVLYLVVGGAYAVAWFVAPVAAAVGFVLLTWLHWGQGDLYPLVALLPGDHPVGPGGRALTGVVRGALPMVLPLVAFPGRYQTVLGWFTAPFGASPAAIAPLFAPATRFGLALGVAALTVAALGLGYRRAGPSTAWLVDAAETGLLWAYFLVVPPVLAVGVYFALWHSLRHVGRLVALDGAAGRALSRGRPLLALCRFGREALPLSIMAVVLFAGFALLVPRPPASPGELAGLALVFIAVLTLPHVIVVSVLDAEQGVWPGGVAGS